MNMREDQLFVIETKQLHHRTEARVKALARLFLDVPQDADLTIGYTETGKPFFSNLQKALFFSVTHSGDYWMCLFSTAEVGIDLQQHTEHTRTEKIARRFFHPEEIQYLTRRGGEPFFLLWAAKESFVKYTGTGIAGQFAGFSVVEQDAVKKEIEGIPLRVLEEFPQYTCCICGGTGEAVRIIPVEDPV